MRTPMVTRTIGFIRCEIMALDTVNGTVQTVTVDYTGLQKQDDRILKDIKNTWQNDDVALVKITSKEEIEQLYGMREEDFIRYATPMESRTSKI